MTIGEWQIDDAGMIIHLKCSSKTWAYTHRCWVPDAPSRCSYKGLLTGYYIQVRAPEMVILISKNQYEVWNASREEAARTGVWR